MTLIDSVVISLCIVLAFGKLQPIVETNYDTDFVYNCIQNLHEQHKFNTFIIFTNTREKTMPKHIVTPPIERVLQERLGVHVVIWDKHGGLLQEDVIGSNNLIVVFINDIADPILVHIDETLRHQHHHPVVFVYRRIDLVTPTAQERLIFFEWCWRHKFLSTLLIYEDQKLHTEDYGVRHIESMIPRIFGYNPFPRVRVLDWSDSLCNAAIDLKRVSNVKGRKFRLPFIEFAPFTFLTDYRNNKRLAKHTISGVSSRLLSEYIKHINGTSDLVLMTNVSLERLSLMPSFDEIDVGIVPFSSNQILGSYPIGSSNICIVVPVVQEIPLPTYLANFIFGKGNIICLLTVPLICFFKYLTQRERCLRNLLFETFALFMSQAGSVMPFRNLPPSTKIVHVAYLIWSMLVLSVYIGGMTSLLSERLAGRQIETLEDFLATDLEIMIEDGGKQLFWDTGMLPADLVPRLHIDDGDTLREHVSVLNTSFAYVVLKEYWEFLLIKQARLTIPSFRIAGENLCSAQFFFKYPMQWDSPYSSSLNEFILRTRENGLWYHWIKDSYNEAKKMGLLDILPINESQNSRPLTMEHFSGFFIFYFCCIGAAIFIFNVELIIYKLRT